MFIFVQLWADYCNIVIAVSLLYQLIDFCHSKGHFAVLIFKFSNKNVAVFTVVCNFTQQKFIHSGYIAVFETVAVCQHHRWQYINIQFFCCSNNLASGILNKGEITGAVCCVIQTVAGQGDGYLFCQ